MKALISEALRISFLLVTLVFLGLWLHVFGFSMEAGMVIALLVGIILMVRRS